jgi:hypothetical protein
VAAVVEAEAADGGEEAAAGMAAVTAAMGGVAAAAVAETAGKTGMPMLHSCILAYYCPLSALRPVWLSHEMTFIHR